jgi:hypothetical protein
LVFHPALLLYKPPHASMAMPAPRTPIRRPDWAIRARAPLVGRVVGGPVLPGEVVATTVEVEVLLMVGTTTTVVLG